MGLWVSLLGPTMPYGWSPNAIVKVLPLNFFSLKKNVIRNLEFQGGHSNLTLKADNKNLLKVISYLCLVKSKLVDFRYLNRALLLHRLELFQRIECISWCAILSNSPTASKAHSASAAKLSLLSKARHRYLCGAFKKSTKLTQHSRLNS